MAKATTGQATKFKSAINKAVDSLKGRKFTSEDITSYLRNHERRTLKELIDVHGKSGKGNGEFYTASSYIGQQLKSLSKKTKTHSAILKDLGFIGISPDSNNGNSVIARFEHIDETGNNSGVTNNSIGNNSHPDEVSDQDFDSEVENARKLGIDALEKKLKDQPKGPPSTDEKTITVFTRSPDVVAWVLLSAESKCERCGWQGFEKTNGGYFLEVHHLKPLAEGGEDKIDNAVGVCPNCHRELHYGKNKEQLLKELKDNLSRKRLKSSSPN